MRSLNSRSAASTADDSDTSVLASTPVNVCSSRRSPAPQRRSSVRPAEQMRPPRPADRLRARSFRRWASGRWLLNSHGDAAALHGHALRQVVLVDQGVDVRVVAVADEPEVPGDSRGEEGWVMGRSPTDSFDWVLDQERAPRRSVRKPSCRLSRSRVLKAGASSGGVLERTRPVAHRRVVRPALDLSSGWARRRRAGRSISLSAAHGRPPGTAEVPRRRPPVAR